MKFTPRILIAVLNSLLVLVLYVFYFLFFIVARIIPGKLYRKIIQTVYNSSVIIWRSIVFLSNSTKVTWLGDKIDVKDAAIVISNHVQSTDMAILAEMAAKFGPGHGFARYIVKKSVIYVPFFGLVHWLLGDVFLQRKWEQDQRTMTNFTRTFPQSLSKWLVIFPEGTRAGGRKKLALSQEWAKENGYPALSHVMYPRPRGFATLVQGFQKHNSVDCVYDVTILYPQADLTRTARTMDMLCGGRKQHIAVVVNRFPISSLPSDDHGIQQWLFARWQTKQKYYDAWLQSGFDTAAVSRVHASPVGRNTTQVDRVPVETSSTTPAATTPTTTPTAPLSAVSPAPAAVDSAVAPAAVSAPGSAGKRRVRATT